jgi:AI-2 transport protein TqsA
LAVTNEIDRGKIMVPFLAILTLIAVGMVLKVAQSVILPLMIAWLLSYIVGPIISFTAARRVPTPLSTILVLTLLLFVCYLGGIFFFGRVTVFVGEYPRYQDKLATIIQDVSSRWQHGFNPFGGIDWPKQIGSWVGALAGNVLSFISKLIMVIIFLVFLLLGKPFFKYKLRKALPPDKAGTVDHIVSGIASQISRYLYIQFLLSFVTGCLVWLALTLLKVDFAVSWGALAFFLNFIPTLGSIMASIPPILLALVQYYPQVWPAVTTALVLTTIQMVIGNGVAPKVMGDKLNLSPVVVLLSLIFWGWLWGITGAILSVPIAAAIKIVCENVEPLRPISVMMGSGKTYSHEFAMDRG